MMSTNEHHINPKNFPDSNIGIMPASARRRSAGALCLFIAERILSDALPKTALLGGCGVNGRRVPGSSGAPLVPGPLTRASRRVSYPARHFSGVGSPGSKNTNSKHAGAEATVRVASHGRGHCALARCGLLRHAGPSANAHAQFTPLRIADSKP